MKHMGKRIGCAALAAQMLLAPTAQAAGSLRQMLDKSMTAPMINHAAICLEHQKQKRETFPQLRRLSARSAERDAGVAIPFNDFSVAAVTSDGMVTTMPDETADIDTADGETTQTDGTADSSELPETEQDSGSAKTSSLNHAPRRRGGISTFSIGGEYEYLDTTTLLAIFGFGPEYRVTRDYENNSQDEQDSDYQYLYNIEDADGKSWFNFRKEGSANERYAVDNSLSGRGWTLQPINDGKNFPYLFGQTYDAKSLYLNESDEEFEWRNGGTDQYFIGALPGSDEYKNENGIDLPRLPNKEFTNQWYVLGSKAISKDYGFCVNIDGIDTKVFDTFPNMFTNKLLDDRPEYYYKLAYNEERDFYKFDPNEPLSTFEYDSGNNPENGNYYAMMDSYTNGHVENLPTTLPIIGKWKDSSNATLTALGIMITAQEKRSAAANLYPINKDQSLNELREMTYRQLNRANDDFDPEILDYFLRLPAGIKNLYIQDGAVRSYEPGSVVTLSATYKGLDAPVKYDLEGRETRTYDALGKPDNSFENPARSIWTLLDSDSFIPAFKEGHELEKITFHVVPPSGEEAEAKDYVIHIQQLQDPELMKEPGNTPMGMVERDAGLTDDKKRQAEEYFCEHTTFLNEFRPKDTAHNNGGVYWGGTYQRDAWGKNADEEANVDLDPSAIVVYPNTKFDVPGFSILNALGVTEDKATMIDRIDSELPDGDPSEQIPNVTWKLELTTVDKLSPDLFTTANTDGATRTVQTFTGDAEVGTIDLTGYNIRPGVYTLSYTYTDRYDGKVHTGQTGDSFDRTVVILPLHGDVDMDGAVTSADGIALRSLLNDHSTALSCDSVESSLYYYRVCDIDGNGVVDGGDVSCLLAGYSSKECDYMKSSEGGEYFYIPLPGGEHRQAIEAEVSSDITVPSVGMKYLGVGTDAAALDASERLDFDLTRDDVFWIEVRLNNVDSVAPFDGDTLTSFTATLTYNPDYVEPYIDPLYRSWSDYAISLNPQWQGWEIHPCSPDSGGEAKLIGITPVTTPSKALSKLEGMTSKTASQEVRFSVTPTTSSVNKNPLTSGSVLKVPFLLKKFPTGKTNKDMKLVELGLSPRDFMLTTETDGKGKAALWDNAPVYKYPTDNTNLKDVLAFAGSEGVKIGKDVTPRYYVYVKEDDYGTDGNTSEYGKNLIYGHGTLVEMNSYGVRAGEQDLPENRKSFAEGTTTVAKLVWDDEAPGAEGDWSYAENLRTLRITPRKAGEFNFHIEGSPTPYCLVVDKSPLTLTANDEKKYYGEATTTPQTFIYDKEQIVPQDKTKGNNTGDGSDLKSVIGDYTPLDFTLVTTVENGEAVVATTKPGDYTVRFEGGENANYVFRYVRKDIADDKDGHISDEFGTATLTVFPRPLLVGKVTKTPAYTFTDKTLTRGIAGTAASGEVTFAGLETRADLSGYNAATKTINGIPITPSITVVGDDKLEIEYKGMAQGNENDPAPPSTEFNLTEDVEDREAIINSIVLTQNSETQYDRYELKNKTESDPGSPEKRFVPVDPSATVRVTKQKMTKLEIQRTPDRPVDKYSYDKGLDLSGLLVAAYYSDDPGETPRQEGQSLENLKKTIGVEAYWVDGENERPAKDATPAKDKEPLHVSARNGKWLCLTDSATKSVCAYLGPFKVEKKELTLTVNTATRYYGESNPVGEVSYDYGELAEWDRDAHPDHDDDALDNLGELEKWLPGYEAPKVVCRKTATATGEEVTATTDVGTYFATIFGGSADDYKFVFTRTATSGTEGKDDKLGYAPLTILPRPILITKITASAGVIYHDGETNIKESAEAKVGDGKADFEAALPQTEGSQNYYIYSEGTPKPYTVDSHWTLTAPAIPDGATLTALYKGTFKPDNEQFPWYNISEFGNTLSREVDVDVTSLTLDEDSGKNYVLLYPNAEAASKRWAGNRQEDSVTKGTVKLRKIKELVLTAPTHMTDYIYGQMLDLTGMKVTITYVSENGAAPAEETIPYENSTVNGVTTTTFGQRGLTLHMGSADGTEVVDRQRLSVANSGQHLYVTGPDYGDGNLPAKASTTQALKIKKKELPLTVSGMTRKYGEENGVYTYTFKTEDLAEWDRPLVGSNTLSGTANELDTASTSVALLGVDSAFVGPKFKTDASKKSVVGGYDLKLEGGFMANYELQPNTGTITVERRPIRVDAITRDPVYTISENAFTGGTQRPTFSNVTYGPGEFTVSCPSGMGITDPPIVDGDTIKIQVDGYVDGFSRPVTPDDFQNTDEIRRDAVIEKIVLTGDSNSNYTLYNPVNGAGNLTNPITQTDGAAVHRRMIQAIRVAQLPQMTYEYGKPLDLTAMTIEITYAKDDGTTERISVTNPTAMHELHFNYWDATKPAPTAAELNADPSILDAHPAKSGDHLTRATDGDGFAHNGTKLLVSAQSYDGTYVNSVFADGVITVRPLSLTYTLNAEDKDYDHDRKAEGSITLNNVYGTDEVWVKNGTDYAGNVPSDHTFVSGDEGITFTFTDENVCYGHSDGHDTFLDIQKIPVEVTGITLAGKDSANYAIPSEVLTTTKDLKPGQAGVPSAIIRPIQRTAPAVKTSLWVDEHTNTVRVTAAQKPESFGDSQDKHNTLHYEYALVYKDEQGKAVITPYQDDPYFGGERVSMDTASSRSGGQETDPEDGNFGKRVKLPRATWVGALVRLAQTNNYLASPGQSSFDTALQVAQGEDKDTQLLSALSAASAQAEKRPLPEPEKETDRQVERLPGTVIKTYAYRIDLCSSTQEKVGDKDVFTPALEAVWFTDIPEFTKEADLNRLVGNEPVRYRSYCWNIQKSVRLDFPVAMSKDIYVDLPVADSTSGGRVKTLMNPNGTARIYVSFSTMGGGGGGAAGNPRRLTIIPEGTLTLNRIGETARLKVKVYPENLAEKSVTWTSSDEKVVTVSQDGLVTAVGVGKATITATARKGGASDTIEVVVLADTSRDNVPYEKTMFNSAFTGAFFDLPASGMFEPERTMTRREMAVVMNHFFQAVKDRIPGEVSPYIDIGDDPTNDAIKNLDRWGIVTGVGENVFAPERIVTRGEMSVILCRMLMLPAVTDPNAPHAFIDAQPGVHWAWGYIDALAAAGITNGTGDGRYSPERQVKRAEMAAFLCRALITTVDRTKGPVIIPVDVPETHWAYSYIIRAVNSAPVVRLKDAYLVTAEENGEKK